MYTKQLFLKIKIKTLVNEARDIRREELRRRGTSEATLLRDHRLYVVRPATRDNLIAYAIIRGRNYLAIEPHCRTPPNWSEIAKLVERFGVCQHFDFSRDKYETHGEVEDRRAAQAARLEAARKQTNVMPHRQSSRATAAA